MFANIRKVKKSAEGSKDCGLAETTDSWKDKGEQEGRRARKGEECLFSNEDRSGRKGDCCKDMEIRTVSIANQRPKIKRN